jgi:hypothetical protein
MQVGLHFLFASTKSVYLHEQLYHNFSPLIVMSYNQFRGNLTKRVLMFSLQSLREAIISVARFTSILFGISKWSNSRQPVNLQ